MGVRRQRQLLIGFLPLAWLYSRPLRRPTGTGDLVPLGLALLGDSSLPAVMVVHLVDQGITKHHTFMIPCHSVPAARAASACDAAPAASSPATSASGNDCAYSCRACRLAGVSLVRNACSIRLPFIPTSQHAARGEDKHPARLVCRWGQLPPPSAYAPGAPGPACRRPCDRQCTFVAEHAWAWSTWLFRHCLQL